jgi:hypothetical protein
MFTSLIRDGPFVPLVENRLRMFYGYLDMMAELPMRGRRLRGGAARRTRAALGHALSFTTWRSLVEQEALGGGDAVALMYRLVEDAGRAP